MADEPFVNNENEEDENDFAEEDEDRARQRPRRFAHRTTTYRRSVHFSRRRKVCTFCVDKVKIISWKEVEPLRRFIEDSGNIRPRRKTGLCAKHQRRLAVAVKRARHLALLPYTGEHVRLAGRG